MLGRMRSFLRGERGSVAVMLAAVIIPTIIAVGVSTDLMHAYLVKNRLSAALDSAALAAGANNGTSSQLQTLAASYLNANFPASDGVVLNPPTYNLGSSPVTITASATVQTAFLKAVGVPTITVSALSQVTRQTSGLEVALVLDNTGSLYCCNGQNGNNQTNIQALRQAAGKLAITLFGGVDAGNKTLRVGVVPYNGAVNPVPVVIPNGSTTPSQFATSLIAAATEPSYVSKIQSYYPYQAPSADFSSSSDDPTKWLGCVEESAAYKGLGSSPSSSQIGTALDAGVNTASGAFTIFYNQPSSSNGWTNSWTAKTPSSATRYVTAMRWPDGSTPKGPNRGCPVPVTPLTSDLAPVLTTIGVNADGSLKSAAGMNAWSGTDTNGAFGMAWGYRLLSPTGPYAGVSTINAWSTQNWRKAVVLMTDGANSYANIYTGIGPYTSGYSATAIINQEKAACDLLKSKGVTIFAVFLNSNSTPDGAISYCAGTQAGVSDSNYFFQADNQQALTSAFQRIGQQLTNLRISQ